MGLWHAIGEQLSHPAGIGGRIIGHAMRWANAWPTKLAIDALAPQSGDHVLDVGCGPGHGVAVLAERIANGRIVGVDGSATMITQARKANLRAIRQGRVDLMVADFTDLPFQPGSFDGILASNVIYFWRDPAGMTGALRGLLKPGGRLVIYATAKRTMRRWKFAATGTHRWIDRSILLDALIEGGFAYDRIDIQEVTLPAKVAGLIAIASVQ